MDSTHDKWVGPRRSISRFFHATLRVYKREGPMAFHRARIQLMILIVTAAILPVFALHNIILFGSLSPAIAMTAGMGVFVSVILFFLLRSGHALISGNSLQMLVTGLLWYWMFHGSASTLNRLDTIILVVAGMFMAPLLTNGAGLYFHHGLNALLLIIFLARNPEAGNLTSTALKSYAMDASIAVFFSAVVSHLFLRTSERVQRETILTNRNLRGKVRARTERLNRTRELVNASREELRRDMEMARNVQLDFLIGAMPRVREWELAHYFRPCSQVSGDFYDVYSRGDELQGVSLFDVSGHGVASGIITMLAKSIVLRRFQEGAHAPLSRVMEQINQELIREMEDVRNYITGILMRFGDGYVESVNAGHVDVLHRPAQGPAEALLLPNRDHKGTFLGMSVLEGPYPVLRTPIHGGDMLLLYTDGISERENAVGEQYGEARMRKAMDIAAAEPTAGSRLAAIIRDLERFSGERAGEDDETMLLLLKT